jgi:quinol monooxygenase YgiN
MKRWISFLLSLIVVSPGFIDAARADDANTAYIVTYFETAPAGKDKARALARELGNKSRKEAGSLRFEVLQRHAQPNHFAILEAWKDKDAQAAHAAAAHTKAFRENVKALLRSPYDERPHTGLSLGATLTSPGGNAHAVFVVTHVDIVPTEKDKGIGFVKELAEASRKDPGNMRFDVLQQMSRPNHLTVVEIWKDQKAVDAHGVAAHTKQFRGELTPLSGSLYDERLYTLVR